MFHKTDNPKCSFLEQTKAAREERAFEKKKEKAATLIQATVRGWLSRIKFSRNILQEFDDTIPDIPEDGTKSSLKPALHIYYQSCRLLLVWHKERDKERFEKLCRYIVHTLEFESPKFSYVGVALNKEHVIRWISHMNDILWKCCEYLDDLKPEFAGDMKSIVLYLHVLVSFTSTSNWIVLKNKNMEVLKSGMNQLCANLMGQLFHKGFYLILKSLLIRGLGRIKIAFKHATLSAILTLALRPLIAANFSDKLMTILELLSSQQSMRIVFNTLEGSYALCLLANLLQLAYMERDGALKDLSFPTFTVVVTSLLESCQNYVVSKQSNLTHWHPVLGWFAQPMDPALNAAMPHVKLQLNLLWNSPIVQVLLGHLLQQLVQNMDSPQPCSSPSQNSNFSGSNFFKKVLEARGNKTNTQRNYRALGSPEVHRVVLVCSLYHTALNTLTQLQLDILTGLQQNKDYVIKIQFFTICGCFYVPWGLIVDSKLF
ncbi:hypothetical protein BDFB_001114 [Asbolus verrucosus]|uniref:HECT-type E3 ubiquitin transferase n=1 Tax=Asbolus verrucosus TaxID=1661398 RepID=A0A482W6Q1_ASBVE|nr:hypothetical protein BDFB_001114 [Asbolus verrucosus]